MNALKKYIQTTSEPFLFLKTVDKYEYLQVVWLHERHRPKYKYSRHTFRVKIDRPELLLQIALKIFATIKNILVYIGTSLCMYNKLYIFKIENYDTITSLV